jgi:hypothetical protein
MSLSLPTPQALRAPVSIRRELIILAAAIAVGVCVVPPLLWLVGSRALGPYAGGGAGAFMSGFFRGLGTGSFGFWMVALGPYLITLVVRALTGLRRGARADD